MRYMQKRKKLKIKIKITNKINSIFTAQTTANQWTASILITINASINSA